MSVQLLNAAYHAIAVLDLGPMDRLALITLAWRATETGEVRLTRRELGRQIGTDKRVAIRSVNALRAIGLLTPDDRLAINVPALLETARRDAEGDKLSPGCQPVTLQVPNCHPSGDKLSPPEVTACHRKGDKLSPHIDKTIEDNKDTHTPPAGACVREEAPAPSGLPEAATPHDAESFQAFHRSYPQHRTVADVRLLMALWRKAEDAIGGDDAGARLLACLTIAKRTKRWQDKGGTYVSREDNFLSGHYAQYIEDSKQEVRNVRAASRKRSQTESDIAFFAQLDAEISAEDAAARRRVQIEEIYEQGKRDGTLKPLVLACDLARGVTA